MGGGPAGIVAAKTLIARGHSVDLYESDTLGGNVFPGSRAKIKYEMKNYLDYLILEVEKLKKLESFNLINKKADLKTLKAKEYDVIITATGARQCKPPVEGVDNENVVFAVDVLKDPSIVKDAQKIVVIGGGVVGAETAYFLKYEYDKNVTVVEMDKYIMNHTCTANRGHIIHYLEEAGVELLNCTKLVKIEGNEVTVAENVHKSRPNPYNTWSPILPENIENPMDMLRPYKEILVEKKLNADMVVMAAGVRGNNELYFECVKENAAKEVYNVGDSAKGAKVLDAVRGAYRKARSI